MNKLTLYLGHEHPCSYLEDRVARMAFVPSEWPLTRTDYSVLVANGFRRSGELIYRPHCTDCKSCLPVRVPVDRFRPNRIQRRIRKINADIRVVETPAVFNEEQYQLYVRYLGSRHPESEMRLSSPQDYMDFLGHKGSDCTRFIEFRHQDELVAVAVVDVLDDGLSAVYTWFEPRFSSRSLGTLDVLWQIEEARRRELQNVYLGFWIRECRKMAYKSGFQPIEVFQDGSGWQIIESPECKGL